MSQKDLPFIFKRFLMTFLPLAIIIAAILAYIYYTEAKSERVVIENSDVYNATILKKILASEFDSVTQDLMFLANYHGLQMMLNGGEAAQSQIKEDFLKFSHWKKRYDQIRFLDESGMEIVRVTYNNGKPSIVPQDKLQNKGTRYYFKDAFDLNKGEVFVSPLDLNIERGQIEQPLKPMIRFGTPVFDKKGKKRGIVLFNYFGAKMLDDFQRVSHTSGQLMLVNAEGYFLKGMNPMDEWGFMYKDRKDRKFENILPEAWKTMNDLETGQFYINDGLFTFATIFPLSEIQKSSTGAADAHARSRHYIKAKEYNWKIITYVKPAVLGKTSNRVLKNILALYAVLFVLLTVVTWILASSHWKQKKADEDLKASAERIKHINQELQDFTHIVSHDLQEPLRKVTAFGDRLKTKYGEILGDQGTDYIERMVNATRRMQAFINDLLAFSRVATKTQPFAPVDLGEVAQEVVSDLEIRVEETGGKIEIDNMSSIDGDPLQMRQLLQNLIGNALKFNKKDEPPVVKVKGEIIQGNERSSNTDYSDRKCYELTVEDNGIGFDEQHTDRIFGIFQRLNGRSEYEGSGIGLSICKKIAERHGGSIIAKSAPGQGAKFIVTLPLSQPKEVLNNG